MLTIYGDRLPLRVLEEIRQWKMQEKEHTVVLRQLTASLEPHFVTALQQWERVFDRTERSAHRAILEELHAEQPSMPDWKPLLTESIEQSRAFMSMLLQLSESGGFAAKLLPVRIVAQHAIRISQHYLSIAEAIPNRLEANPTRPTVRRSDERSPHRYELTQTSEGTWTMSKMEDELPPAFPAKHAMADLPYEEDALEPCISKKQVQLHRQAQQASLMKLNRAEAEATENFVGKPGPASLPYLQYRRSELALEQRLHGLYWDGLGPVDATKPDEGIIRQIKRDYGSLDRFMRAFGALAEQADSSGWAVLAWNKVLHRTEMALLTSALPVQFETLSFAPLIVLDLAEHAYSLDYGTRRSEYVEQWWTLVDWKKISSRLRDCLKPLPGNPIP